MDRLGYTSPRELLAEKFHMSQDLLRKLNPGASFDKEGQEIVVANVEHESLSGKISRVEVDPNRQRVKASEGDKVVALYPATVASEDRPTPRGDFKVTKITENLVYHYDPALHFRGVHVNEKLNLPPGLNNPVGACGSIFPPRVTASMAHLIRTRSANLHHMAAFVSRTGMRLSLQNISARERPS